MSATRVAVGASAACLLSYGGLAALTGVHDATLRDAPLVTNAVGGLVFAGGLLWLITGGLLAGEVKRGALRHAYGRWGLVGALAMALSGAFMWLAELRSAAKSWVFLAAFGLVIAVGCGIFLLIRLACGVRPGRVSVSILALAGFLFGLFQFWYANEYTPSTAPPALTMAATLTPPAKTEGAIAPESVSVTLKNTGSTKVIVLGSTYAVTRMEQAAGDGTANPFAPYTSLAANPEVARLNAVVPQGTAEVVLQAGKVLPEFQVIEAGQEIQQRFIARVPAAAKGTLRLGVSLLTARGVRLRVGPKRVLDSDPPDVNVYVAAGLRDDSWLRDLIDGKERVVVVRYHPLEKWPVAMQARIIPAKDPYDYRSEEFVEKYTSALAESLGLTTSYAFDEIATTPRTKTPKPSPTPGATPDKPSGRRSPCGRRH